MRSSAPARVACDLHGHGDVRFVLAGVRVALESDPALSVVLVGEPPADDLIATSLAGLDRWEARPATPLIADPEDAPRAVRGQRAASVRVAARLLRDGEVDACVLLGPVPVALAAAQFALRLLPGATAPVIAARVGESVLVDVSGHPDLDRAGVVPTALLGAEYARAAGLRSRVAVLTATGIADDSPAGRRLLAALRPYAQAGLLELAGGIGVAELVTGSSEPAVVVTDGFSGNVLREAVGAAEAGPEVVRTSHAGGVVLGFEGVVVVGRPETSEAYAAALDEAARAHRAGLAGGAAKALADLVAWRRMSAGLNPVQP